MLPGFVDKWCAWSNTDSMERVIHACMPMMYHHGSNFWKESNFQYFYSNCWPSPIHRFHAQNNHVRQRTNHQIDMVTTKVQVCSGYVQCRRVVFNENEYSGGTKSRSSNRSYSPVKTLPRQYLITESIHVHPFRNIAVSNQTDRFESDIGLEGYSMNSFKEGLCSRILNLVRFDSLIARAYVQSDPLTYSSSYCKVAHPNDFLTTISILYT